MYTIMNIMSAYPRGCTRGFTIGYFGILQHTRDVAVYQIHESRIRDKYQEV